MDWLIILVLLIVSLFILFGLKRKGIKLGNSGAFGLLFLWPVALASLTSWSFAGKIVALVFMYLGVLLLVRNIHRAGRA